MQDIEQRFGALHQHIDNLEPAAIQSELDPIMGVGGRGALSGAIARHQIDPANPNDPMIDLIETIRCKLGQDGDARLRANLGGKVVKSIGTAFHSGEYAPETYEGVSALADEAEKFTDLIEAPRSRSDSLFELSRELTKVDLSRTEYPDSLFAVALSSEFLDKAAEAAREIEDPAGRAYYIQEIAEQSVANINVAAKISGSMYAGSEELPAYLHEQTLRLYGEVFAEADNSATEQAEEFYEHQAVDSLPLSVISIASDMVRSAPDIYETLTDMSIARIDRVISEAKEGQLAAMDGRWQASVLSGIGSQITRMLGDKFYGAELGIDSSELVERLSERSDVLFEMALEKAQGAEKTAKEDRVVYDENLNNVTWAARIRAEFDMPGAKKLVGIAFGLAAVEDSHDEVRRGSPRHRGLVEKAVDDLDSLANQSSSSSDKLGLYAEAHKLIGGHASNKRERALNATNWVRNLREADAESMGELDEDARTFVEFAVKKSDSIGNLETVSYVLSEVPGNDKIELAIKDRIKAIRKEAAKKEARSKEPQSLAELMMREVIQSL